MCRNIRVLYNFDPPTTPDEVRAAALQYVRKVSGVSKPSHSDERAFERATEAIAKATDRLLLSITADTATRTREGEREKAKARWALRGERLRPG
jgi:hypothetical protein